MWRFRFAQSSTPSARGVGCLDHGRAADQAEQGGWTGRHPQATNDPGSRLATQCERQEAHHLGEANGPTSIGGHHCGQPFGEDPTRAGRLAAEELADAQLKTDRLTAPRQISDGPLVQAVDRLGPGAAHWGRSLEATGLKRGDDLVRSDRHVSEPETVIGRKKTGSEGTSAWHHSKSYRPPPGSSPKVRESPIM